MRALLCILASAGPLLAAADTITAAEAGEGWIQLFDGRSLAGWVQESGKWKINDGIISSDGSESGSLKTKTAFSDFVLKLEYRSTADPDAALMARISGEGSAQDSGYEVRLGDTD